MNTVNPKVARWMSLIADALEDVGECELGWGTFHVKEVVIQFDGEDCNFRVRPDEGDGTTFELVFGA